MRLLRPILILFVLLLLAGGLLAVAVFTPLVQTRYVQHALARHPEWHAYVDWVDAGRQHLHLSDVHLNVDGVVLTLPSLDADVPMKRALWDHEYKIAAVTAKGWILDLSQRPAPSVPTPAPQPAAGGAVPNPGDSGPSRGGQPPTPAGVVRGLLSRLQIPWDVTIDQMELEGDVILPAVARDEPGRVHVIARGGGLSPGRTAELTVDVSGVGLAANQAPETMTARGQVRATLDQHRAVAKLEFAGQVASDAVALPQDLKVALAVARAGAGETYALRLSRAGREVLVLDAGLADALRLAGTWRADLRAADVAPFDPQHRLAGLSGHGAGHFELPISGGAVHASGDAVVAAPNWNVIHPALAGVGAATTSISFDGTRRGAVLAVSRLKVSLTGPAASVEFEARQPFEIDTATGKVTAGRPGQDLLQGTVHALPLALLPELPAGFSLEGTATRGDFAAVVGPNGIELRTGTAWHAPNATLRRNRDVVASDLGLTLSGSATYRGANGWSVSARPLVIERAGAPLLTFTGECIPQPDAYGRVALSGKLAANLDAIAGTHPGGLVAGITARQASAEFTAHLGAAADVNATIELIGHDSTHRVTATLTAGIDDYASGTFQLPLRVALGPDVAEVSVEGKWDARGDHTTFDAAVAALKISADQLRLLAHSLPMAREVMAAGAPFRASAGSATAAPDPRPFWDGLTGRLRLEFRQVTEPERTIDDVAGTLEFSRDELALHGGRAVFNPVTTQKVALRDAMETKFEPRSAYTAEGTLTFVPGTPRPYRVKAKGGVDVIDAARLFGAPAEGHVPLNEGQWEVADTVSGDGANLADLLARRQEEFRLTSKGGTLRLLKTNVDDAIPEAKSTAVGDSLANVGSAVGSFFGVRRGSTSLDRNRLDAKTEAVLDVTYQTAEIGYDDITVTATRGADQVIHLAEIAITTPKEHLTGTGEIAATPTGPLPTRPITLDLRLGLKGVPADRLTTAGVLAGAKDALGYDVVPAPLLFKGTLTQIQPIGWHDVLVRAIQAARAKPAK